MVKAPAGTKNQVRYYSTKKHYYQRIEDIADEARKSGYSRLQNKIVPFINSNGTFLDVACGTGSIVDTYRIDGSKYYGIDMSSIGLKIMKESGRGNPIRGDVSSLPF